MAARDLQREVFAEAKVSLIDLLLLAAILAVSASWIAAAEVGRRILRLAPFALAALVALQLAVEGPCWQFLAAGPLLLATILLALRRRTAPLPRLGQLGLAVLMVVALGPWALLPPVPRLTAPGGAYPVGTQVFRWTDASRPEPATAAPDDRRSVIAQAWYPRAAAVGPSAPYIDGLAHLPRSVTVLPGFILRNYGRVDTHAVLNAPVADNRRQWPVVVFSPGYGAPRAFYTSLATALASRGYVVLALDHPYEAAVTQLPNGQIATPVERFLPGDPDRIGYMVGHLEVRAADVRFAVDQLSRPAVIGPRLAGRLDLDHIAAIGHSFGGATAAVALDRDPRIKAAANIDGTLYGTISQKSLQRPFLLLESDHSESSHSPANLTDNQRLLDHLAAGGYRYEIARANHFSFTDAPLFFAPPGRFLLARLIGGSRGPSETQQATADILAAFLQGPLTGTPASVETAVGRYRDIKGGPVRPAAD